MTVINGADLLLMSPIMEMVGHKRTEHGVSYGLGEAGYDIRLKQEIWFSPPSPSFVFGNWSRLAPEDIDKFMLGNIRVVDDGKETNETGRFTLASAIEEFNMPNDLVGVVHDKSSWARKGLSVFNTVIEPGWRGYLTLELDFKGNKPLHLPAGAGIAQVLFHQTSEKGFYNGKYQHQANRPVESIYEKG